MWNPPWKEELGGSKNFTSPNFSNTINHQHTYSTLKALSIYDYLDGDTTLTEPVSFPNNVEGGIGLVSISTESVATIKFKRTYYDLRYWLDN